MATRVEHLTERERAVRRDWLANAVRMPRHGVCGRCGKLTEVVRQYRGRRFECVDCWDERR